MNHIVDFIFTKKEEYKKLSDKDKEDFFFIINRKFARQYPKQSQFFNNKTVDKASALDIWYMFFVKQRSFGIPKWYWFKRITSDVKNILKKEEIEYLLDMYDITENDLKFLQSEFPDEVNEEVKKFKKFNKK